MAPGQRKNFGTIEARTWVTRNASAERAPAWVDSVANPVGDSVAVHKDSAKILVRHADKQSETGITDAQYGLPATSAAVAYRYFYRDTDGEWKWMYHFENPPGASNQFKGSIMRACTAAFSVCASDRILPDDTFTNLLETRSTNSGNTLLASDTSYALVPAIDPVARSIKARRSADNDSIALDWVATTNERSHQRIVWQLTVAALGGAKSTLYHETSGTDAWDARQVLAWPVSTTTNYGQFRTASGAALTLANVDLKKEIVMWIEARQSGGDTPWKMSPKVTLAAVSSGGSG